MNLKCLLISLLILNVIQFVDSHRKSHKSLKVAKRSRRLDEEDDEKERNLKDAENQNPNEEESSSEKSETDSNSNSEESKTGSNEEESEKSQEEEQEAVGEGDDEDAPLEERLAFYKRISEDLDVYEEEYLECFKNLEDEDFSQMNIEGCVGKSFIKVVLDIKYISLKVMAHLDTFLRKIFFDECYTPAAEEPEFSIGCDVLEKDILDMMWNGLEFHELSEINKEKYTVEYGKVPADVFMAILVYLKDESEEFFKQLDEIDAHKDNIILKLQNYIDDRKKEIQERQKEDESFVGPLEIGENEINHDVDVEEMVCDQPPIVPEIPENIQQEEVAEEVEAEDGNQDEEKVEGEETENQDEGAEEKAPENAPQEQPTEAETRKMRTRKIEIIKRKNNIDLHNKRKLEIEAKIRRNKLFREQTINNKNKNVRLHSQTPIKNVHTKNYLQGKK